jgi:hypothetical protein
MQSEIKVPDIAALRGTANRPEIQPRDQQPIEMTQLTIRKSGQHCLTSVGARSRFHAKISSRTAISAALTGEFDIERIAISESKDAEKLASVGIRMSDFHLARVDAGRSGGGHDHFAVGFVTESAGGTHAMTEPAQLTGVRDPRRTKRVDEAHVVN